MAKANTANALMQGDFRRRIKDKLVRLFVSGGGLLVMLAFVLIFFYLAYVVLPLFERPTVVVNTRFDLAFSSNPVQIGFDEKNQFAYRYSETGDVAIFSLADPAQSQRHIKIANKPSSFFADPLSSGITAFGLRDGIVTFQQLRFITSDAAGKLTVTPNFQRLGSVRLANNQAVSSVSFSEQCDNRVLVGVIDGLIAQDNVVVVWQKKGHEVARTQFRSEKGAKVLLSPNGKKLFVLTKKAIVRYTLSSSYQLTDRESIDFDRAPPITPESMRFLAGGHSLLVRFDNGLMGQWFDVIRDNKRTLVMAREFALQTGLVAVEAYRNVFASLSQTGALSLWHATTEIEDTFHFPSLTKAKAMAFSLQGDRLLIEQNNGLMLLDVNNLHPDVSFRSLWQKIWYEGYSEPDYVWQSTANNTNYEGKLSVMPLLFGSLKVAFYSLFFAVPLAVGSAIYTAYFMSAGLRNVVKPTIEMMEALPTVILGFLAGLWLAPIIERSLFAVGLIFIVTPLSFLLMAFIWAILPAAWCKTSWYKNASQGAHLYLLLPLILLIGYASFHFGPTLELHILGGDSRAFLTDVLGIDFDQRNAIVIGLAMGFAVIPTIFTISEDAIYSVPRHLTTGSLALGATYFQTLTRVVLLTASPGIFSAVMMGLGRAVGESMIVLMATGNTPLMEINPFEGLRSLSANIALEMPESGVGGSHYRVLFLTAFMLFTFTFLFNSVAELVRQQLREKYRAL